MHKSFMGNRKHQNNINTSVEGITSELSTLVGIKKYMSWDKGNLVFGEVSEGTEAANNAYTLQIDNDSITIKYEGKVLSEWVRDQFLVSKLIYKDNTIENGKPKFTHGFQFVANQDGSFSLKRVDLEVTE